MLEFAFHMYFLVCLYFAITVYRLFASCYLFSICWDLEGIRIESNVWISPLFLAKSRVPMASSWRRTLGNARSFVSNSMGGLRGGSNIASWIVAGTLAYFLWIKPSQDLKREQQVSSFPLHLIGFVRFSRTFSIYALPLCNISKSLTTLQEKAALASADPYRYVEKRKPIPDPQVRRLPHSLPYASCILWLTRLCDSLSTSRLPHFNFKIEFLVTSFSRKEGWYTATKIRVVRRMINSGIQVLVSWLSTMVVHGLLLADLHNSTTVEQ